MKTNPLAIKHTCFALCLISIIGLTPAVSADEAAKPVIPAPAVSEEMARQQSKAPLIEIFNIGQTVLKMSLQPGVTPDAAIESMLSKAVALNLKIVGHQKVSEEVKARGLPANRLEIFQFCNPEDAIKMVEFNPIYAAYMPCRIALVEDKDHKFWLTMLNLDMLINKIPLSDELRRIAITTNGSMLEIITTGSMGAL